MEEDIDFQIRFFEDLMEDDQNFIDVLIPLADAYTKKGWFEKGLCLDKKLADLRPDDPNIIYNLSCSYALLNMVREALETLKKALDLGYHDLDWLAQDPDLAGLRNNEGYKKLIKTYFPEAGTD